MSLPLAARGPVSGRSSPILIGPFCAGAGPGVSKKPTARAAVTITASVASLRMSISLGDGRNDCGSESRARRAWHSAWPDARLRPPDPRRHVDDEIVATYRLARRPAVPARRRLRDQPAAAGSPRRARAARRRGARHAPRGLRRPPGPLGGSARDPEAGRALDRLRGPPRGSEHE